MVTFDCKVDVRERKVENINLVNPYYLREQGPVVVMEL